MAPMEDDPNVWEESVRVLKSLFDWFTSFSGLLVPALAGAVIGAFKEERRKRGKRKLFLSILMSAACGCGLTPLFGHVFSIPAPVAASLAFFLGIWGLEGIEVVQSVLRSKVGDTSTRHEFEDSDTPFAHGAGNDTTESMHEEAKPHDTPSTHGSARNP